MEYKDESTVKMFEWFFRSLSMRTFLISFCCCFLHYISAQHDNQQMTFYPNPVFLQYPESNLQNPINIPYSFSNNGKITETINEKVPLNGINNFRINTRRFDSPVEMPYRIDYEEERPRNARYQVRPDDFYSKFHDVASESWQPLKRSEHKYRRPRYSRKDAPSVHRSILMGDHLPQTRDAKRNQKVVKYIADENGVALREDLLHSLQGTISGSRRKPRILTGASSSPLMAKVVTSAIRVSNHQPITDGKYLPQVIDLKIGK